MPFLVLMCMFFSIPSFATELTDTGGTETNNVADSVSLAPKDYVKSPWFDYSELSDRFMTKNGEFGSYGRLVIQAMQRVGQKCFHETIDFSKICPGYKGMTVQKKDQFMVFLFASIALHDANNHMLGAYKKIQTNQGRASWNALKGKPFDEKYYLSMPAKMDFGPAGLFGINVSVPARKASRRPQPYCFG
ncbi:MAG: hypothetical protein KDD33_13690, partial [Bdellovibrionales bacterium]|nr:hypothetical protein [Bdellovibrionales bacterium]